LTVEDVEEDPSQDQGDRLEPIKVSSESTRWTFRITQDPKTTQKLHKQPSAFTNLTTP
jgi:hypothetical protein